MKKLIWLLSIFVLFSFSRIAFSAGVNTTANGKDGKIIADVAVSDTAFYTASTIGIADNIMKGRAIVDAHRKMKTDSYKTVMNHDDRVTTNVDRLIKMRDKLQKLGFIDGNGDGSEWDLIQQSESADIKAGVVEKDRWK